jgi:hypothetical protein
VLSKIGEPDAVEMLGPEFLGRDANVRALAEDIGYGIFISQIERLEDVNHAAETITG